MDTMKQNTTLALSNIFGNCPDVKILECFADNHKDSLSISDIVYLSNVPRTTVYRKIKKLLEEKIIEKGRKYGKTQLYKLDIDNEIARSIVDLEALIVQKGMEKTMKEEGMEIPYTVPIGRLVDDRGIPKATVDFVVDKSDFLSTTGTAYNLKKEEAKV